MEPEAFRETLIETHRRYGLPIYVLENGTACRDEIDAEGAVSDQPRIDYLRAYTDSMFEAINDGADVRGYFVWSLLDNFEWGSGYSQRFGLVYVDYSTQRRIPKASFRWYARLIKSVSAYPTNRGADLIAMAHGKKASRIRFSRFWSSASGFWRGKSALASWPLTIGLLAIGLTQLAVQYRLNYWNRDFFNALELRDSSRLWHQAILFVPFACLSVGLSVTSVWGRMATQRRWREWLTTNILDNWLSQEHYRRLESVTGEYQNAEYRISVDARTATDAPVDLALGFVTSALTALVFIDVLWNVGGSLTVMLGQAEVTVPGYLVIGVGIYALIFTSAMMAIGRNLPTVIQAETQAEAEWIACTHQIRESGKRTTAVAGEIEKRQLA